MREREKEKVKLKLPAEPVVISTNCFYLCRTLYGAAVTIFVQITTVFFLCCCWCQLALPHWCCCCRCWIDCSHHISSLFPLFRQSQTHTHSTGLSRQCSCRRLPQLISHYHHHHHHHHTHLSHRISHSALQRWVLWSTTATANCKVQTISPSFTFIGKVYQRLVNWKVLSLSYLVSFYF